MTIAVEQLTHNILTPPPDFFFCRQSTSDQQAGWMSTVPLALRYSDIPNFFVLRLQHLGPSLSFMGLSVLLNIPVCFFVLA